MEKLLTYQQFESLYRKGERDFSGREFAKNCDFESRKFEGCNFSHCTIISGVFSGCCLKKCNFDHARLIGADFSNALFFDCTLSATNLSAARLIGMELNRSMPFEIDVYGSRITEEDCIDYLVSRGVKNR